jgi:hypothetical protein
LDFSSRNQWRSRCGSFACWLIARLYEWDPSVFYLDFGQSLHIWFLDNPDLWLSWLLFHPRLIMENCHLDEFYRDRNLKVDPPFSLPQTEAAAVG